MTAGAGVRAPGRRRMAALLAWGLLVLAVLGVVVIFWLDQMLLQAGRHDLSLFTADAAPLILAVISATTVGAVLGGQRPRHPVGWLLLGLGLSIVFAGVADGWALYTLLVRPGTLPGGAYGAVVSDISFITWPALTSFVILLTPTGTLPSPRWRWWAWVAATAPLVFVVVAWLRSTPLDPPYQSVVSPLAVPALTGPLRPVGYLAVFTCQAAVLVAAASLVVRFRRARGVERQQLRWVVLAAGLSALAAGVVVVGIIVDVEVLYVGAAAVYLAILPLAIGAAVLRYRLYDLDRIISRTLAYAILTVLLGASYAAIVVALGQLLPAEESLLVAAATLAVAAAFQPARRRVQDLVDRRFNRRRYDAVRTIDAFSARLRQQVDLDALTAELLTVVDQTMQPARRSLWLRPAPPAAAPPTGRDEASAGRPAAAPSTRR